jgi:hypothetical protein
MTNEGGGSQISIWEHGWWGDCVNTLGEEVRQLLYAQKMGLVRMETQKSPFIFDMKGASVVDIGGGPVSLLLKCINVSGTVIDAGVYPKWVHERYKTANITHVVEAAENLAVIGHDEAWVYNSLQHTVNPSIVLTNAKRAAKTVRIFQWINTIVSQDSPHILTRKFFDNILEVDGTVETINLFGYVGYGYYAVASK